MMQSNLFGTQSRRALIMGDTSASGKRRRQSAWRHCKPDLQFAVVACWVVRRETDVCCSATRRCCVKMSSLIRGQSLFITATSVLSDNALPWRRLQSQKTCNSDLKQVSNHVIYKSWFKSIWVKYELELINQSVIIYDSSSNHFLTIFIYVFFENHELHTMHLKALQRDLCMQCQSPASLISVETF